MDPKMKDEPCCEPAVKSCCKIEAWSADPEAEAALLRDD